MEIGDQDSNTIRDEVNPIPAPRQLGSKSLFITPRSEGGLRDVINVECLKINGEDFKGAITYTEANIKIYQQKLGLRPENLHSVNMSFNKYRIVSFKLREQINIDEMADREEFTLKRSYMQGTEIKTDVISCKITQIRKPRMSTELPRPQFDRSENDVQ